MTKQTKISTQMLFTWLMLGSLIIFFCPQKLTGKIQFAFARMFRWPLSAGRSISLFSSPSVQQSRDAFVQKEDQYQNYIANLEAELDQERKKVEKLAGLRERRPLEGAAMLLADIITFSADGMGGLLINRGAQDGLVRELYVLSDNSVIGTVADVSARTAEVWLFTDPRSKMAVRIGTLDVDRIMKGNGDNSAGVQLFPINYKVKVGDIVYASKKAGFLDVPVIVGRVAKCRRDDDNPLFWDIKVAPACDIRELSGLAVLIMNPND